MGLLLGLLIGTCLYIAGGYFLPFLVYSIVMLSVVPFGAKLIPNKPLEDKPSNKSDDKNSDEDNMSVGDIENGKARESTADEDNPFEQASAKTKTSINPFKLVWSLLRNKVS